MYQKYLSCLLLCFNLSYNLQNQNNISIEKNKVNIYGDFNGRRYEDILLNNKTEIILYEKPDSDEGDPNLLQHNKSLIPNVDGVDVYIKQIQYVPQIITAPHVKQSAALLYNKQKWHEIKITFSNDQVKNYLVPELTNITMTDTTLSMHSNMKISALSGSGIIIKGVRSQKNKNKTYKE